MDGFSPPPDAGQKLVEEAAIAASSTPHHDGARFRDAVKRDERAVVVPFARAAPGNAAFPPFATFAAPIILVAPPLSTPIPDFARQVVAGVVERGAREKNVPLAPNEADGVVNAVLAALDLADLYRVAMADPVTVKKAAERISIELDGVAIQRIMRL